MTKIERIQIENIKAILVEHGFLSGSDLNKIIGLADKSESFWKELQQLGDWEETPAVGLKYSLYPHESQTLFQFV